jgi:hypothetical protein
MIVEVIENYLPDPDKERAAAIAAIYKPEEHNGLNYRGISKVEDPENYERIKKILGLGEQENESWTCFWRLYLANEESETFIHSDCQIGTCTSMVFLNTPEQCKGGVAFWRHKLYGWDKQPSTQQVEALGLQDTKEFWESVWQDGFDERKWEMIDYVPMDYNRMVMFDSNRFHSRYPKKAFGKDINDGRLVKVFFYQT